MCGRAACTLAPEEIQKQTQAKAFEGAEEYRPSYNIAPHQMHVAMLLDADGQPILKLMRWGLVRGIKKTTHPSLRLNLVCGSGAELEQGRHGKDAHHQRSCRVTDHQQHVARRRQAQALHHPRQWVLHNFTLFFKLK